MAGDATYPELVCTAIADALAAFEAIDRTAVFTTLTPEDMPVAPPSAAFLTVSFATLAQPPEAVTTDAPTDLVPAVDGLFVVGVWVSMPTDTQGRDDNLMTRKAGPLLRRVVGALSNRPLSLAPSEALLTQLGEPLLTQFGQPILIQLGGAEAFLATPTFVDVRNRGAVRAAPTWRRFDVRFRVLFRWSLL